MAYTYCRYLYEKNIGTCYCLNTNSPFHYFQDKKWLPEIEALETKKALAHEQFGKDCKMIELKVL